ncbi:MAG: dihydrolipoyl dehydrogenase [Candidatus Firestonebacteria bacterium]
MNYDVLVIGGGPGGYVAAIRAAQLGAKVAIVEKEELGGTCLNHGCIPTKALLSSANIYHKLGRAKDFGIIVQGFSIDFNAVIDRKDRLVKRLRMGIGSILKSYNIELIKGAASFTGGSSVMAGDKFISFKKCIIATGSVAADIPGLATNGKNIITSTEILNMKELPSSLLIIGGGVIGIEFASLFSRIGVKVTVVEALNKILPFEDPEIASAMTSHLAKKGVEIHTGAKVLKITGTTAEVEKSGEKLSLTADKILIAAGRKPNYEGLGLEKAGIALENKRIKINDKLETNIRGVYAIGDAASKYMLAYVASAEGIIAAENACGKDSKIDHKIIPTCVFTAPEIAHVGLTETEAKEKGLNYKIGRFPFAASGRAQILNETEGFIKVLIDEKTDGLLGVHIIGPEATEIIHSGSIAMKLETTTKELERIIFNHPTLSEGLMEAAHDAHKEAIDLPKRV